MISKLNDLLTKNYDAEAGYKMAAEKVENTSLKGFLEQRAKDRYDFGHDIKDELKKIGGEPDKGTSVLGDLHRAWIGLKDALTSGDQAIYEECIRGEKAFVDEYEEVLNDRDTLPQSIVEMVQTQLTKGKSALAEVKALEEFND